MRTDAEYAILRAARINKENAWDVIRASQFDADEIYNDAWNNYAEAAKIVEELEEPQSQRITP
jgi:hypothetical protein